MTLDELKPLIYGGMALTLSLCVLIRTRNAIQRIRDLGREDPTTLRRVAALQLFGGVNLLVGLVVAALLFMLQVDGSFALFGLTEIGMMRAAGLLLVAGIFNALLLDWIGQR